MKVKIEFDTDINNSFDEMGMYDRDVVANVLRHLANKVESGVVNDYNVIEKDDHYPIGMFSLLKSK
jgi:hypothetical protein